MAVDQATVDELVALERRLPDAGLCGALNTVPEVLAYLAASALAEGRDATEDIELVVAAARLSQAELIEARSVLSALGYGPTISDLLKRLARHAPRPRRRTMPRHTPSALAARR